MGQNVSIVFLKGFRSRRALYHLSALSEAEVNLLHHVDQRHQTGNYQNLSLWNMWVSSLMMLYSLCLVLSLKAKVMQWNKRQPSRVTWDVFSKDRCFLSCGPFMLFTSSVFTVYHGRSESLPKMFQKWLGTFKWGSINNTWHKDKCSQSPVNQLSGVNRVINQISCPYSHKWELTSRNQGCLLYQAVFVTWKGESVGFSHFQLTASLKPVCFVQTKVLHKKAKNTATSHNHNMLFKWY